MGDPVVGPVALSPNEMKAAAFITDILAVSTAERRAEIVKAVNLLVADLPAEAKVSEGVWMDDSVGGHCAGDTDAAAERSFRRGFTQGVAAAEKAMQQGYSCLDIEAWRHDILLAWRAAPYVEQRAYPPAPNREFSWTDMGLPGYRKEHA